MQFSLWAQRLAVVWPLYYAANCTYGVSFIISMLNLQFYGKENQGKRLWRLEFLLLVVRFPGKAIYAKYKSHTFRPILPVLKTHQHSHSQLAFVISANFSLPQLARFAIFSKALERLKNDANRLHIFLMNYLAYYWFFYIGYYLDYYYQRLVNYIWTTNVDIFVVMIRWKTSAKCWINKSAAIDCIPPKCSHYYFFGVRQPKIVDFAHLVIP